MGAAQIAVAQPRLEGSPALEPDVEISDETSCIEDVAALEARLLSTLNSVEDGPLPLEVEIAATPAGASGATVRVLLRARLGADIVLARTWDTLKRVDCAAVPGLIFAAVERFVEGFPVEEWRKSVPDPIATPTPLPTPQPTPPGATYQLHAAWGSKVVPGAQSPVGAEAEVGFLRVAAAQRLPITLGATFRAAWPSPLGTGQFQTTGLFFGVGWHQELGPWRVQAEGRGGAILHSGTGFAVNSQLTAPWLEASIRGGRRFGPWQAGAQACLAPLRHRIGYIDANGLPQNQPVAQFRVGLFLSYELP